jgi:hypothetical protein
LQKRLGTAGAAFALVLAACGGGSGSGSIAPGGNPTTITPDTAHVAAVSRAVPNQSSGNVVQNPGFETGSLPPWTSCGSTSHAGVSTAQAHSGSYSAFLGTKGTPEVNGTAGICQTVTVPASGTLTFWVYETTTDTIEYADQEADIENASGTVLTQLYKEADSTNGWEEKTFSLSAYAGQTVVLYFGVKGNGYSSAYINEYLDDVSLTGSGSTPTPSPTPSTCPTSPGCTPTPSPTTSPTASPTASPTTSPTSSPTTQPYACNNTQFDTYQSEFANGTLSSDQEVDVCGQVTQVLAKEKTSSGTHGYFYVSIPGSASPGTIEIVSNLTAMGEDPNPPPSTWPWVAVGDYVYVQGRYYYDDSSSQGIDWTEDDTDSNWTHTGYVVVCDASGSDCNLYE